MLEMSEFSIGAFRDAQPLSLILPRDDRGETVLIGHVEGAAAAVFLSERFANEYFFTAGSDNWDGLIIPNVRIEVDETSAFDASYAHKLGALIRTETRLAIRARADRTTSPNLVTLQDGLPPRGPFKTGFGQWHIVLGEGFGKRVLWQSPKANV